MISRRTKIVYFIPSFGENLRPCSIPLFWVRFPLACLMPLVSKAAVWRVPTRDVPLNNTRVGQNKQHWGQFSASTITARVWGSLFVLKINHDVAHHHYSWIFLKKRRVGDFVNFMGFSTWGERIPLIPRENLPTCWPPLARRGWSSY